MKQTLPTTSTQVSTASQDQESPRILRIITELRDRTVYSKIFWVNVICGFLVASISYVGYQDYQTYQHVEQVKEAREQVIAEMHYWETVVKKYPKYRDGYFMLASINEQLGNIDKAREYNGKALQLDPDFQEGKDFEQTLN